jgi:hypothetical protein
MLVTMPRLVSRQSWFTAVAWVRRSMEGKREELADLVREKAGGPPAPNPRKATIEQLRSELAELYDPRTLTDRACFVEVCRSLG